jgi:AcrR family transcriptional regulator
MARPTRSAPPTAKAEETRTRIRDAALSLFSEVGFGAASTKKIAERAGVSEGLIFHYFPQKTDLLLAIAATGPVVAAGLAALLDEAKTQAAAHFVPAFARLVLTTVRREAAFFNTMLGESHSNPDLYQVFRTVVDRNARLLGEYLVARQQAGDVRADLPVDTAARGLIAALFLFFMTKRHLSDRAWKTAVDRYADELGDVWVRGIT